MIDVQAMSLSDGELQHEILVALKGVQEAEAKVRRLQAEMQRRINLSHETYTSRTAGETK